MSSFRKPMLPRGSNRFSPHMCNNDFTPTKWSTYFENQKEVFVDNSVFTAYSSGNKGPVLFMIHGGGYSALSWALFSKEITNRIDCQICAIDLRGHGNTKTEDEINLSLNVLVEDVVTIVDLLFSRLTPIILIGHSLGGSIAVSAASLISNVVGLCVIDVVEGTALEALPSMRNILRNRPKSFDTIEQAIQWSFNNGQQRNLEADRVSVPGQIKNTLTSKLAANECDEKTDRVINQPRPAHQLANTTIQEEDQDNMNEENCKFEKFDDEKQHTLPSLSSKLYTWRIDLSKTDCFWDGWFNGLSQKFLKVKVPKILLLANINGLDTTLTVGQMQGKFQLQVLPKSGHAIHESRPQRVADVIARFLIKQELALPKHEF